MNKKPEVGQTMYSLNIGNAARSRKQELTPMVVTKVGRKYFTCCRPDNEWTATQYHLTSWREKTEYCANSQIYATVQEWEDEAEAEKISAEIKDAFDYGKNRLNLPIETLREIQQLLDR